MKTYKERTQSILNKAEALKEKRNKRIKMFTALGGIAAAVLAFNLVLFVPYTVGDTNISKYSASEYYSVIQQLYPLTYSPSKTNNFNEWFGWLGKGLGAEAPWDNAMSEAPTSDGNGAGGSYVETTLNQTEKVTEGDLFKRSDTHIFYLGFTPAQYDVVIDESENGSNKILTSKPAEFSLRVYTIADDDSELVAEYKISADEGTSFDGYTAAREMFLSEDLTAVTVVSPCYDYDYGALYTVAVSLDVSDISDIKEVGRTYVSGRYVSSRTVNGNMLLISNFSVPRNVDFSNEAQFLPQVGKRGSLKTLPLNNIVCPDDASTARYTVVCTLDKNMTVIDSVALLSYSDDVYVSQNNLFTAREYIESVTTHNKYQLSYSYGMSEIRVIPYKDGTLGETRAVSVAGSVLNRYCLDEYDGVLRAATTVRFYSTAFTVNKGEVNPYEGVFDDRCMLYCIDLDTLETKAEITDFAPIGESVKSARFYGNTAYVCTAEVSFAPNGNILLTDPVFAFDLSDLDNITYKDTGTIPGYSLSLIGFTDGTLLGIGYGDDRSTLKIEVYEETENNVTPLVAYENNDVHFSTEFKAHFIDKKNGLVGLGVRKLFTGSDNYRYTLLRFDGYELNEILSVEMTSNESIMQRPDNMRATYIDGYIYIFANNDFKVIKIA